MKDWIVYQSIDGSYTVRFSEGANLDDINPMRCWQCDTLKEAKQLAIELISDDMIELVKNIERIRMIK